MTVVLAAEGFLVSSLVARQSSTKFLAAVVPAEVISLTNEERISNSVGNLAPSELLTKAAQAKAEDMAKVGYFSHTGPDGKEPWEWIKEAGYEYQYAGENLAVRFIDSRDVVDAWMVSPSHRANIVKGVYTMIGVGVAQGFYEGEPATYVVQYFATPKSVSAAVQKPTSSVPAVAALPTTATTTATTTAPTSSTVAGVTTDFTRESATAAQAQVQTQSFSQSIMRQLVRAFAEPRQTANLALGLSAAVVLIALLFAFFMHLQVQHPVMLATGATVVGLALFFLTLNIHLVAGTNTPQTAAVQVSQGGVVITPRAAETGYALFP
jgi:hypothetical protein